ncbi:MAG: TRAP transporter large permease [Desulfatiglans sp.]|jgi:tripartite ATP-independent transporter DctM subunit|nr:TRAP transporter large permease [Thermodesulfobacteriota bacterium]MEE4354319.1 TRAP transporter large permease [Desulfatiglans sp.]
MDPLILGVISIFVLFFLLALRIPIAVVLLLIGLLGNAYLVGWKASLGILGMVPFTNISNFILTCIPLFILMGMFISVSGLLRDIYSSGYSWLGHLPGGLAHATIVACTGFAAVCGSGIAAAATMGTATLPEMSRYKYDARLATGSVAGGSTLGIIIPPSIPLIVYGVLTETSIGKVLVAGVVPGLLCAALFMGMIYFWAKRNPAIAPPGPRSGWKERFVSLKGTSPVIIIFLLVIGGIYAGFFTPTEAAAVGAFGSFILALSRGRMTWKGLFTALEQTGRTTCMIFLIIIGAMLYMHFLALTYLPMELADFVAGLPFSRHVILTLILVLFILMGCVLDIVGLLVLLLPIVFPVVKGLGFDPIWFGVIVTLTGAMALITPPVGLCAYALSGVAKDVPLGVVFKGILPFFLIQMASLIILVAFPEITLFLPRLMG